jgi:hypothetical protein
MGRLSAARGAALLRPSLEEHRNHTTGARPHKSILPSVSKPRSLPCHRIAFPNRPKRYSRRSPRSEANASIAFAINPSCIPASFRPIPMPLAEAASRPELRRVTPLSCGYVARSLLTPHRSSFAASCHRGESFSSDNKVPTNRWGFSPRGIAVIRRFHAESAFHASTSGRPIASR